MRRPAIRQIDFLKMDIEGNEYKALKGAGELLKNGMIKAIQIEFGGCNLDSRTYLRDYWELLHDDFDMYRVGRSGLIKLEIYEETMELFITTNYLFVQKQIEG